MLSDASFLCPPFTASCLTNFSFLCIHSLCRKQNQSVRTGKCVEHWWAVVIDDRWSESESAREVGGVVGTKGSSSRVWEVSGSGDTVEEGDSFFPTKWLLSSSANCAFKPVHPEL